MKFTPTHLAGSFIVEPVPFADERGWFARTYCEREFADIGHDAKWVQLNHSFTTNRGTIRGMHFQHPPHGEVKLVRCIAGEVFDVIIDLRHGSPTFLDWFGTVLSASNRQMIYVPTGFAHGFQTLTDNCELIYHHSQFFQPGVEGGVRYDEPRVGISWPLPVSALSARDDGHPPLLGDFVGL